MDLTFAAYDIYLALFETWHPDKDTLNFISHNGSDLDGVVQEACVDQGLTAYGQRGIAVAEFGIRDVCWGDG